MSRIDRAETHASGVAVITPNTRKVIGSISDRHILAFVLKFTIARFSVARTDRADTRALLVEWLPRPPNAKGRRFDP